MKLRTQLLLAGALSLALPFVSWSYLGELNGLLRDAGQRALQTRINMLEAVLRQAPQLDSLAPSATPLRDLYAEYSEHEITLDGYTADWSDLQQTPRHFRYADNKTTATVGSGATLAELDVRAAVSDQYLYLHFEVSDNQTVYHDPNRGLQISGDRLELFFEHGENDYKRFVLRAIAPGLIQSLQVLSIGQGENLLLKESRIQAFWEPTSAGYSIEVRAPLPVNGSGFGLALTDVDEPEFAGDDAWIGTLDPQYPVLSGHLHYRSGALQNYLRDLTPEASRLRVFDADGWLRAEVDRLDDTPAGETLIDPRTAGFVDAVMYRFFAWLMADPKAAAEDLYSLQGSTRLQPLPDLPPQEPLAEGRYKVSGIALLGGLRRLGMPDVPQGFLLLETADESIGAALNSTLVRLFGVLFLLVAALITGLLIYASWISLRVRKISLATSGALQRDGKIAAEIPGLGATDEIGDLSRTIDELLRRLASYTDYLQALASRLTHELRTPLAVVSTSLESIKKQSLSPQDERFMQRALGGTQRLQGLIRSLSEATRLEQAVQGAEFSEFDLVDWLEAVTPMYQDLYPQREIAFS
ncbi:MAG: hypothetical protein KDJ38_06650, partial [Gammaproteobacteria bacterium]|nr:hypothetical protein [Gammaproteobacteria bacterium]